ncbi:MAG: restriction endonuclease subunit S [Balneolaceae bacterium]
MVVKNIFDICNPKQWRTISKSTLKEEGYPVYGANGKIGFYSEYNHKEPTVLITCRGATCGEINISEPYSYITGNAMCLDDLSDDVNLKYLFYYLKGRNMSDVISGTAQPQITKTNLRKLEVPLPSLDEQKAIVDKLDRAQRLIDIDREMLAKYDELIQSVFLDMFGDPVTNPKGWRKVEIKKLGEVVTGNTPSKKDSDNYGNHIEWIKTTNIQESRVYPTKATEFLSKKGSRTGRIIPKNSLIVSCIAGSLSSIGKSAVTDRKIAINQQINAIIPEHDKVDVFFLYGQLIVAQELVQNASTKSMKGMVSKSRFKKIELIKPDTKIQKTFCKYFHIIINEKKVLKEIINKEKRILKSLMYEVF